MVEAVGIAGTGSGAGVLRAPGIAAVVAAAAETEASSPLGVKPISPSSRADPTTGVLITEFFTSEGQVRMQIPSQVAIAYLRSGLTATGTPADGASEKAATDPGAVGVLA